MPETWEVGAIGTVVLYRMVGKTSLTRQNLSRP